MKVILSLDSDDFDRAAERQAEATEGETVSWPNVTDTPCASNNPSSTDGGSFSWMRCQDSEFGGRITKTCSTGLKSRQETCFVRAEKLSRI